MGEKCSAIQASAVPAFRSRDERSLSLLMGAAEQLQGGIHSGVATCGGPVSKRWCRQRDMGLGSARRIRILGSLLSRGSVHGLDRNRSAELRPDRLLVQVVGIRRDLRTEVSAHGRIREADNDCGAWLA